MSTHEKSTIERLLQAMSDYAKAKWAYEESFGSRSEAWRRPALHGRVEESITMVEDLIGEYVDERIAAASPRDES